MRFKIKEYTDTLMNAFFDIKVPKKFKIVAILSILLLTFLSAGNAYSLAFLFYKLSISTFHYLIYIGFGSITFFLQFMTIWYWLKIIVSDKKIKLSERLITSYILLLLQIIIGSINSLVLMSSNKIHDLESLQLILEKRTLLDYTFTGCIIFIQLLTILVNAILKKLFIEENNKEKNSKKISEYDIVNKYLNDTFSNSEILTTYDTIKYFNNSNSIAFKKLLFDKIRYYNKIDLNDNYSEENKSLIEKFVSRESQKNNQVVINQIKIFDFIQHELINYFYPVRKGLDHLKDFLNNNYQDILNQKLDSSDKYSVSINELLGKIQENVEYSSLILNDMEQIVNCDPEKINKTEINLHQTVKREFDNFDFQDKSINLKINIDTTTLINVDNKQFKILFKNIFSNALRHAFTEQKNYTIEFNYKEENGFNCLEILNDGNKFVEGFTEEYFKEPLKKIGDTGNTGIGGFLIDLVVKNHGGKITPKDCSKINPLYNVSFLIEFPI